MSKRKHRKDDVPASLKRWSDTRTIEMLEFSPIHRRLTGGFTSVDIWPTTGRYWVGQTEYHKMTDEKIIERGGEKGELPVGNEAILEFLDKLFFAADM